MVELAGPSPTCPRTTPVSMIERSVILVFETFIWCA
jgi:hypothetical protein